MPKLPPPYQSTPFWKPWFVYLCTPGIKVLVNECMAEIFLIRIYIYIYIFSQIVHHNPCFNLFMLHNNQGSEIKNISLRFNILSFKKLSTYYQRMYYYLPTSKKVFVKDSKSKRKKILFMYIYNTILYTI